MVLTEYCSCSEEEYLKSPGLNRQEEQFRWKWDICESNVRAGHECITSNDRMVSKATKAKLTFGEVLDSGVLRMLYNLGAIRKKRFHDLGMGTGKMLVQSFLAFPNLDICVGVELSKGRYLLAEQNLTRLLQNGWRGRKFLLVEFQQGSFMKIVESSLVKKSNYKMGDIVIAYNVNLKKNKKDMPDYKATVVGFAGDQIVVSYGGKKRYKVDLNFVFEPGTERTCEIWQGNLFDYPGAWNGDLCILETDFPSEMHSELLSCMTKTPIGCRFLTYLDLKKLENFQHEKLRQLDVNVYDSDRYLTSWSQGWRFYCWEHIRDLKEPQSLPPSVTAQSLLNEEKIRIYHKRKKRWMWGKVRTVNQNKRLEVDLLNCRKKVNCYIKDNRIALHRPRFRIGEQVSAFHPEWACRTQFSMFDGEVVRHHADGSYCISWETFRGVRMLKIPEQWIFSRNKNKYSQGDQILSCWTDYALNKNSPKRYKKFKAVIKNVNANGTYSVEFHFGERKRYSDCVREMWITTEREEREYELALEDWDEDPVVSLCTKVAREWTPRCVATFLMECSNEARIDLANSIRIVLQKKVCGEDFISMDKVMLVKCLGMSSSFAKHFYDRFMYWVHIRMDNPPVGAQKRRVKMCCEIPGGGPTHSRMS